MADERDLDGLLPKSPTPDGDRRSATIDAALRRFDAREGAGGEGTEPATAAPRSRLARPQLAVLASAMLVLLVALPVLLNRGEDLRRITSAEEAATRSADVQSAAPAPVQREQHRARFAAASPTGEPEEMATPSITPTEPPETGTSAGTARNAVPPPNELEAAPEPSPEPSSAEAVADRRAPQFSNLITPTARDIAPSPAQPPGEERLAEAPPAEGSIVVTGSRVEAGPANFIGKSTSRLRPSSRQIRRWQACTLADPREDAARCDTEDTAGSAELVRGLEQAFQGKDEAALRAFDAVIALAPQSSGGYLNRGLLYQRKRDVDAALRDLNRAIRVAPGDARGYYFRSLLLREDGDAESADKDLETALELDKR